MTILFDATHPVKPARRNFALGLSRPGRPERTAPFTTADLEWAAANLNRNARDYEVIGPADSLIEQAAGCALALARLELGVCPF